MDNNDKLINITKELVEQITGCSVEDCQNPDFQIAFYYINKAFNIHSIKN